MDTRYYLAVDIGASSGRHMLSHMENGKMVLEEIYRFPNGMTEKAGHKVWDVDTLFEEILTGMKKCLEMGKIPYSMGIDTWAVDFVLLDENDKMIGDAVAYRDDRTKDIDKAVYPFVSETELYTRTGIQKQSFNTIYQLMAVKKTKAGHVCKCKDNAYDTGLLPFPFNRKEGSGIYQCNNYPVDKCKNKGLGLSAYREDWISAGSVFRNKKSGI